ncbi:hypothetical protein [Streptomyces sp. NPDC001083]|uniref:hypothetical protein n=1 Tax=Streptomyces sp. NPDC001083 TaxID=3364545 RepID=UPI0036C9D1E7
MAPALPDGPPDLVWAIVARSKVCGARTTALGLDTNPAEAVAAVDRIAADVLVLPRSERWREAVSTALAGNLVRAAVDDRTAAGHRAQRAEGGDARPAERAAV